MMTRDDRRIRDALRLEVGLRAIARSVFRPGDLPLQARLDMFRMMWGWR